MKSYEFIKMLYTDKTVSELVEILTSNKKALLKLIELVVADGETVEHVIKILGGNINNI